MDWREFLEKDALDGKGANDKIKDPKWVNTGNKQRNMSPKKYLDNTNSTNDITSKRYNSGKLTTLSDSHSNDEHSHFTDANRRSSQLNDSDGNSDWRGNELGSVEFHKRKLRRGEKIYNPELMHTDNDKNQINQHEGRNRSRAAMEEGIEKIPVGMVNGNVEGDLKGERGSTNSFAHGHHKYDNSDWSQLHRLRESGRDKDTRHPMLGRKKSWQDWLEKTEPTGLTARQKKLAKEIADGDKDDHTQYYTKTSWESWLEKGDDDEYHSVMNDVVNERKGSKYDKNTKQWTNPVGMPSRQHCGATSTSLSNRGYGKKVSGKYHGTWDGKPEDHSWVENKDGHIIDASRDQFHGDKEQGIKTIKQNHPDYSKYKKNPNCPSCGTDKPPTKFTNLRTRCTGDNCNHFEDEAPEIFEKHHGRKHRDIKELNTFRKEAESQSNALHGIGKSWESWLDKNNGIETDHKKENKKEWDGKFSSSTIRDDAKDEKAESEEESLEELTDGKLEEVEKLKSWEIFLKKFGGTEHAVGETFSEEEAKKRPDMQKKNPPKYIKSHFANPNTGKDAVIGTGKQEQTPKVGTFQDTKNTKNLTENDVTAGAVRTAKKYPELKQYVPEAQVEEDKGLGGDTETPVKTQEELDKEFYERTQPEPKGTKSHKKVIARRTRKSWELFLEKGITYRDPNNKETDPKKIRENALIASEKPVIKSWSEWLEKQQGAGDARFGNQHLTGMEQHPVADDDSLELSPETEENNEKQEKTEDKEDKDNKPYKALSQE
jgi:hypothetical protein